MIAPFEVVIPEAAIADLRARLRATRWPEPATVDGLDQGVPWSSRANCAGTGWRTTTSGW